ncbi:MAG: class I SAM-dependent methyltransferase [Candidatus Methanofastidiosia archaeon]|jgi:ubiquinone/menaquinone biosynthesis C-methylase UbiE
MDNKTREITAAWNILSKYYQESVRISTEDVHYGTLSYGEKRLNLIGPVKGKTVLEIGCGGGQNTIALARKGADAFGIDPSKPQISHARHLTKICNTPASFCTASAEDLPFDSAYFDVGLSSHALGYVYNIEKAFTEVYRVLKNNSIFVFCITHPYFIAVGYYLAEDPEDPEIRPYLSWPEAVSWDWLCNGKPIKMWGYNRTLSQIINPLIETGFTLEKIIEKGIEDVNSMSEKEKDELPYLCNLGEKEYAVERKLPHTLILKLKKG